MSTLHTRLLLLASLLLLGWGFASWLEDGAPWNSLPSHSAENAATSSAVDVRVLIEQESRLRRDSAVSAVSHDDRSVSVEGVEPTIELMSGTTPAPNVESSPAWLTGEIEF